jgi:arabinogalactan oligomer/maltooligosaccharide transport system permease protein
MATSRVRTRIALRAAGAIVTAIPIVGLFLFLQKYPVSGLTAGAVKG